MEDNKQTVSSRRMYAQELALLSLVRRGEAHKKVDRMGKTIYKLECENPWVPTPPQEQRTKIPQMEILTP